MGRVLSGRDLPDLLELLYRDPVSNVFVASRLEAVGVDSGQLGGELWPYVVDGKLQAVCYAGANLVPIGADDDAARSFALRARKSRRRCSSIVGPAAMVATMWEVLETDWGPARELRMCQPLLAIDGPPAVEPDPAVRRATMDDLDVLMPACVSMFTEEVGVSPVAGDGGATYRARLEEIVAAGRSFVRIEDGRVVFKAEVGAATRDVCQVQGVWVDPRLRGLGLSVGGMAAVVAACRTEVAPTISLYVNDFNAPARAAYQRVGFRRVGTFASILF